MRWEDDRESDNVEDDRGSSFRRDDRPRGPRRDDDVVPSHTVPISREPSSIERTDPFRQIPESLQPNSI